MMELAGRAPSLEARGMTKIFGPLVALDDVSIKVCLLYTSPNPRDRQKSRMPSSA